VRRHGAVARYASLGGLAGALSLAAVARAQDSVRLRLITPEGHRYLQTAVFSPDNQWIATSGDGDTKIWEAASGRRIATLNGGAGSFSPDGRFLVTAGPDTVWLWDAHTLERVRTLPNSSQRLDPRPNSTSFSADGRLVLVAGDRYQSRTAIWETATGNRVPIDFQDGCELTYRCGAPSVALLSPDGQYVLTTAFGDRDHTLIKLWEVTTGKLVRRIGKKEDEPPVLAYSPDGKRIATSEGRNIHIWDAATGNEIRRLSERGIVHGMTFSSGGDSLLVSSHTLYSAMGMDGIWRPTPPSIWNLKTGEREASFPFLANWFNGEVVAFSSDVRRAVSGRREFTTVYDLRTRTELRLGGQSDLLNGAVFASDSVVLSTTSAAVLWDIVSGRPVRSFAGKTRDNGRTVYAGGARLVATVQWGIVKAFDPSRDTVRIWNAADGALVRTLTTRDGVCAISYDGKVVATTTGRSADTVMFTDVATGRAIRVFASPARADYRRHITYASLSRDASRAVVGTSYDTHLIDLATGERASLPIAAGFGAATFSRDGQLVALVSDLASTVRVFDTETRQLVATLAGHSDIVMGFAFSPDGQRLATAARDGTGRVWDIGTGRQLFQLNGHSGWVESIDYSPDGRLLVTSARDNSTRIWRAEDGREVMRRYEVTDYSTTTPTPGWVLSAPDGRFDGTEHAVKRLHYVRGVEPVRLDAFYERFFTPGLGGVLLANAPHAGPDIRNGFLRAPNVRIVSPESGPANGTTAVVAVDVRDRGGGAQDIRLYHNGALVGGSARGMSGGAPSCSATACFTVDLLPGANVLEATAFSRDGTEAERAQVTIDVGQAGPTAAVHVLAIGINGYANPRYNLNYARADASAFVDSIVAGGKGLYATIHVDTLYDARATTEAITTSLQRIAREARPQDVFVLFFAGHGTTETVRDTTQFFLVPSNVLQISDPQALTASGLSSARLRELTDAIRARKRLMVIDACRSGELLQAFTRRGPEEERALAMLARASGVFVMSATDSEQSAAEFPALGHGVLTYALLSAMGGGTAAPRMRTVRDIATRAEGAIPDLSRQYRGRPQYPMVWSNGQDFPLVVR